MLRCTIIDDDRTFLDEFKLKLQQTLEEAGYFFEFSLFYNAEEFNFEEKSDVYFIDIEMPGKSGFDVAKQIKLVNKQALIIFVSSNDYAEDAYDIHPYDFINKNKLDKILKRKVSSLLDEIKRNFYKCKMGTVVLEIDANRIIYVISMKHYIYLHYLQNSQIIEIKERKKLNDCYHELNSICKDFVQTSKSEIINMNYIDLYRNNEFSLLILKRTIHISKKYLIQAKERFYNHKLR